MENLVIINMYKNILTPNEGISSTFIYSPTNMLKLVWTNGFWKPLIHIKHVKKICNININFYV